MADPTKSSADLKPGSSAADAAALSGKNDFGVHESDRAERAYASANTKAADYGHAQPHSFEHVGNRESGAGARDNGRGSGSGGDVDPDVIGLGTAGGLATDIDRRAEHDAADAQTGSGPAGASGLVGKVGGPHPQGNVVTPADPRTTDEGADSVANTSDTDVDDSFRGDVSSADASGRDTLGK